MNVEVRIDKNPKKVEKLSDYLRKGPRIEYISDNKYDQWSLSAYIEDERGGRSNLIFGVSKNRNEFWFSETLPILFSSISLEKHIDLTDYPINWYEFRDYMKNNVPEVDFQIAQNSRYDVTGRRVEMPYGRMDAVIGPLEISEENLEKSMHLLRDSIENFYEYAKRYAKDIEEDFKIIVKESSTRFSDTIDFDFI